MKLSRRFFTTFASISVLSWASNPAQAILFSGGSGSGGGGAGQITTLTLSNSGSSTETPTWSKIFGLGFPDSDVTGCPLFGGNPTYPQFKSGSNVIAYSMSVNPTYWASGRLKHATFVLLFNGIVSIPASSTASISVNQTNNTSKPSASSRSLSDFNTADLKHTVTLMDGGTGTYTSSLNTGITDANSDNYVWLDGAAGKMWRIREDYRSGGTAHGALQGYHYVMSMQDGSGNFGGIQYQFCCSVPGADITSTLRKFYSFSSAQLLSGASVIRDNVTSGRTNAYNFTWNGSGSPSLWNVSSGVLESYQIVRLTTTGTLPGNLSTGTSYWIGTPNTNYYSPPYSAYQLYVDLAGGGFVTGSSSGSGTHTMTAYPWVTCYGRIFACGTTGEWDYIQGGGSVAPLSGTVMSNCQIKFDNLYWRGTKLIPSYDFSPTVTTGTSTPFYINTNCGLTIAPDAGGIDEHIGIMPTPFVRHIYTQSLTDERNVRAIGLCQGQIGSNIRLTSNGFKLGCYNNGHNGSGSTYSGMPAPAPTTRWDGAIAESNAYQPVNTTSCNNVTGQTYFDGSHRTQSNYYPALITGQPEYFDMLIEVGNAPVLGGFVNGITNTRIDSTQYGPKGTNSDGSNYGSRNVTTSGTTRYGIWCMGSSPRQDAWHFAMTGMCAGLIPQNHPECAGYWQYFNDIVIDNVAFLNAVIALSPNSYTTANKLFWPSGGYQYFSPWQTVGYVCQALSMVQGHGVTDCSTVLTNLTAWMAHVVNTFGLLPISIEAYLCRSAYDAPSGGFVGAGPLISNDNQFGLEMNFGPGTGPLTWANGSANFTIDVTRIPGIYIPAVGDRITFTNDLPSTTFSPTPSAFNQYQQYFIVSVSGSAGVYTVQLSATSGGSAITNTNSSSTGIEFWVQTASPNNNLASNSVTDYPTMITRSMMMAKSRGITVDSTMLTNLLAAIPASSNSGFASTPTYCFGQTA